MASRVFFFILIVLLTSPAFGQVGAADRETARGLMDVGRQKYESGDFQGALSAFEGADRIMKVTSTGLWVGKALAQVGRLIDARDKLINLRKLPVQSDESTVLSVARDEAQKLQLELADRIPQLEVLISGLHDGARVNIRVGGVEVARETLTLPRKVDPGDHVIIATSPGYADLAVNASVAEGKSTKVVLAFVQTGAIPEDNPQTGDDSGVNVPMWVAFGFGGLGAVVGSVTGAISLSTASAAKEGCDENDSCPPGNEGDADTSLVTAHVSTASFIVGGLGVGVGLVLLLTDDSEGADSAQLQPLVGPGFVGLRGSF
jgi:hypothetical protein